jgi:hypothetical protein
MATLEAKRIQAEAKRQERLVADANPEEENVEIRYILSRIEIREVLRSEWEQLGLLEPKTASAIYTLINAVDGFNLIMAPRDEVFKGTALQLLAEIDAKAECASKLLSWTLQRHAFSII